MSKVLRASIVAATVAMGAVALWKSRERAVARKKDGKVVFIATGTRGDVQPLVTLAQSLQQAGESVLVCTNQCFADLVRAAGVPLHVMGGNPHDVMSAPEVQEAQLTGDWAKLLRAAQVLFSESLDAIEEVGPMAKMIISTPMCWGQSYCIAEKWKVPLSVVMFQPFMPTKSAPVFLFPQPEPEDSEPKQAYLDSYGHLFGMWWKQDRENVNEWRVKKLGLPAIQDEAAGIMGQWFEQQIPIISGFSDVLVPRPVEAKAHVHSAGFIAKDSDKDQIPEYLEQFLSDLAAANKRPPVFLCMGSMPTPPEKLMKLAEKVASELDISVIVSAGWTKSAQTSNDPRVLLVRESLPQRALFPRCSLVIHHCGSGTVGAVIQSGRPSVAVPVLMGDQNYWGELLFRQHAAPKPIGFSKLTPEALVEQVREVLDSKEMSANAERLRAQVASLGCPVKKATNLVLSILRDPKQQVIPQMWSAPVS